MLAIVGIGHQNSPFLTMYLSVGADGGGYTISVPIKMRTLSFYVSTNPGSMRVLLSEAEPHGDLLDL